MIYVFDTSSFRVLNNYFPKNFPTVWKNFDLLVKEKNFISVQEVFKELQPGRNKEFLLTWVESNKNIFFKPTQDKMLFVSKIFAIKQFQNLVAEKQRLKGSPVADPFIIACAKVRNGCVITEEKGKPNAAKIPNICQHFSIECTNVEGLMEREGWRF